MKQLLQMFADVIEIRLFCETVAGKRSFSFFGSVCFRESECQGCVQVSLCLLETTALFYELEHEEGRPRHEFTAQNALLSDVPPSKTYQHSRGEW